MPTPGLSNPDAQLSTLEELRDLWNDHVVRGGTALAGEVLVQKKRVIGVPDIAAAQQRFVNFDWTAKVNHPEKPLSIKGATRFLASAAKISSLTLTKSSWLSIGCGWDK